MCASCRRCCVDATWNTTLSGGVPGESFLIYCMYEYILSRNVYFTMAYLKCVWKWLAEAIIIVNLLQCIMPRTVLFWFCVCYLSRVDILTLVSLIVFLCLFYTNCPCYFFLTASITSFSFCIAPFTQWP